MTLPIELSLMSDDDILFTYLTYRLTKSPFVDNDDLNCACGRILEKKTYSDINVQDSLGNTFLHYCIKGHLWVYAKHFIMLGANPELLNNDGQSAFDLNTASSIDYFKSNYLKVYFDDNFAKNLQLLSPSLKEWCFNNVAKDQNFFSSIEKIKSILIEANLYTKERFFKCILQNRFIQNKISYLINNFNTQEDNSFTLMHVGRPDIYQDNQALFNGFFERRFVFDDNFETIFISACHHLSKASQVEYLKLILGIVARQEMQLHSSKNLMRYINNLPQDIRKHFDILIENHELNKSLSPSSNITPSKNKKI